MTWVKRFLVLHLVCLLGTILVAEPITAGETGKLRVGLLPGETGLEVLRRSQPLKAYLEQRLMQPVELVVGTDYSTTVEALRFGRIDIAYLGPVTYVLGRERARLEPFAVATHRHGPTFTALIITSAESSANSLADLHGQVVAFGDVASTSGHWVPRFMLNSVGLVAGHDYEPRFLGSHDAVALAVARRTVAAGAISQPILDRLIKAGRISDEATKVIAQSPPIPEYVWTFRQGLQQQVQRQIRDAFLTLDDPRVLAVFGVERFTSTTDSEYDIVRQWVRIVRNEARP